MKKIIQIIDKIIKDNKLYYQVKHKNGMFNFQNYQGQNYSGQYAPYEIKNKNKIWSELQKNGYDVVVPNSYTGELIKINNYTVLKQRDNISDYFLMHGYIDSICLVGNSGEIMWALFSKNLPPLIIHDSWESENINVFLKELSIKQNLNLFIKDNKILFSLDAIEKNNYENFAKKNDFNFEKYTAGNISFSKYLNIDNYFDWEKIIFCLTELQYYLDHSDISIFNRADIVFYLANNVNLVQNNFTTLTEENKKSLIKVVNDINLSKIEENIDLVNNHFYKLIEKSCYYDNDYGANKIKKLIFYIKIYLKCEGAEGKENKKSKI